MDHASFFSGTHSVSGGAGTRAPRWPGEEGQKSRGCRTRTRALLGEMMEDVHDR